MCGTFYRQSTYLLGACAGAPFAANRHIGGEARSLECIDEGVIIASLGENASESSGGEPKICCASY